MFDLEPPPERGPYAGYTHPSAPSLDNTNQWGSDAERYFQLARAALATGTAIVEQPTMSGVRALVRALCRGFNLFINAHPLASSS